VSAPSPFVELASPGCTSMRPASPRSRRLPPGKSTSSALAGTRLELHARWPAGAVAARAHRCSKTSTRPSTHRFRGCLPAACASTASADRCFNEHCRGPLEHPGPAKSVAGTAACFDRSSPFDRGQPPKVRGVRGRGSPNPLRSLARLLPRETLPQPRSLQTPRVAVIVRLPAWRRRGGRRSRRRRASLQAWAAAGPCDARSPRRDPTFTNPRGLPS